MIAAHELNALKDSSKNLENYAALLSQSLKCQKNVKYRGKERKRVTEIKRRSLKKERTMPFKGTLN